MFRRQTLWPATRTVFCPDLHLLFVQLAQRVEHEIGVAVCLDGDGKGLRGALKIECAVGERERDAQGRVCCLCAALCADDAPFVEVYAACIAAALDGKRARELR